MVFHLLKFLHWGDAVLWDFWLRGWNGQEATSELSDSEFKSEPVKGFEALGGGPRKDF